MVRRAFSRSSVLLPARGTNLDRDLRRRPEVEFFPGLAEEKLHRAGAPGGRYPCKEGGEPAVQGWRRRSEGRSRDLRGKASFPSSCADARIPMKSSQSAMDSFEGGVVGVSRNARQTPPSPGLPSRLSRLDRLPGSG